MQEVILVQFRTIPASQICTLQQPFLRPLGSLASMGDIPTPQWLKTERLLSQFDENRAVTRRKYSEFLTQAVVNASSWNELKAQCYWVVSHLSRRCGRCLGKNAS